MHDSGSCLYIIFESMKNTFCEISAYTSLRVCLLRLIKAVYSRAARIDIWMCIFIYYDVGKGIF